MAYYGWEEMTFSPVVVIDMIENPEYRRYLLSLIDDEQSVRDAIESILNGDG